MDGDTVTKNLARRTIQSLRGDAMPDPVGPAAPLAFIAEHVCRVTHLTVRQLRYWDKTGFFKPWMGGQHRRQPYGRVYSFRDLVGLQTIALLRGTVPLQELRKVGAWLARHYETPWASLRLYVRGRAVFFDEPESGLRKLARNGVQTAFAIEMDEVSRNTLAAAARLRERHSAHYGKIRRHRYVVHNSFVVAGTRIPASAVWDLHEAGYGTEAIIREYPRLTAADVRAAVAHHQRRLKARAS